jgi:hypothetical protein
MTELKEKLEKWVDADEDYDRGGAVRLLDLLWPVIEAAVHARDTQCPHYAELKCTCVRDTANIAIAALEQALKERGE